MSPKGGRRPGAGRRPKPDEERRRNSVTLALTDEEFEGLRALAAGEPLGVYAQRVVVRHLERTRRAKER